VPVADAVLMTRSLDDGSHRKTVASRRLWWKLKRNTRRRHRTCGRFVHVPPTAAFH
jgi:hypothetical protein